MKMKKSKVIIALLCCGFLAACGLKGSLDLEQDIEEYENIK